MQLLVLQKWQSTPIGLEAAPENYDRINIENSMCPPKFDVTTIKKSMSVESAWTEMD